MNIKIPKHYQVIIGCGCVIFGLIILMYVLGIREGAQQKQRDHDLEIAEYALKLDTAQKRVIDTQIALTECEAVRAGQCALNCEAIAQERIDSVLQDLQEVMCSD